MYPAENNTRIRKALLRSGRALGYGSVLTKRDGESGSVYQAGRGEVPEVVEKSFPTGSDVVPKGTPASR